MSNASCGRDYYISQAQFTNHWKNREEREKQYKCKECYDCDLQSGCAELVYSMIKVLHKEKRVIVNIEIELLLNDARNYCSENGIDFTFEFFKKFYKENRTKYEIKHNNTNI